MLCEILLDRQRHTWVTVQKHGVEIDAVGGASMVTGVRVRVMNRSLIRSSRRVSHIAGRTGRNALSPKLHLQTNIMFCGLLHNNRRECVDERHARRFEI